MNRKLQKERLHPSLESGVNSEDMGNPQNKEEVLLYNADMIEESSISDRLMADEGAHTSVDVKNSVLKTGGCAEIVNVQMSPSGITTVDIRSTLNPESVMEEGTHSGTAETTDANGESSRKRRRQIPKNMKPNARVFLNLCDGKEDTEVANSGLGDTSPIKGLPLQSRVVGGQQLDINISRSLYEMLTIGNVETLKDQNLVVSPLKDSSDHHGAPRIQTRKKLLILDVNGLLADIINPPPKDCKSDINISRRAIFRRPFLDDFLGFCFKKFDVAIWSSRTRKVLDPVVDYLLGDLKNKLLFLWDLSHCTSSTTRSLENKHKCIVFKNLRKIWEENGPIPASKNGYYNESNTLLLDDSPYKALLNPKHTGIFPPSYSYKNTNDNSLAPNGDLRVYLEGVAAADSIKMYVKQHPFGQNPIDETNPHWAFYSKVFKGVS